MNKKRKQLIWIKVTKFIATFNAGEKRKAGATEQIEHNGKEIMRLRSENVNDPAEIDEERKDTIRKEVKAEENNNDLKAEEKEIDDTKKKEEIDNDLKAEDMN